ncbi:hypothetical protein Pmar_PMAR003676 [Perkinsus marinus ATCC 50983]|uniref:RRM domain-containing protein n=1 Tax=Perkinsus marinus (strain ATCC 50983 / TXsc) TaxID=423536 RepID=C5KI01_PERM5|nr:hypothetical protein Pmar_PMAR003676 [Perkinsus marinus ATCC 50983]EER16213.1 hypothetical protein Pmar_PMAR003676 [Perkinsus marinus ATCC 50983]|eukprot:XP_002784417.1 hypothetical protein Pmar_PMAR003676 [Perkinsus marinus ATCC 50983]
MTPPDSATERKAEGLTEKEIEDRLRPIKSIRNYTRGNSGTEVQRLDSLFLCCLMAPVNIMHAIAIVDFKREVQQRYEPPMTDRINDTRYPRCPDARMDLSSATMRECTLLPEIVRHECVVATADGGEKLDCPTPAITVFTEFAVRMLGKSLAELGLIVRLRLKALLDHTDYGNNAIVERWEFIGVLKDWIRGFPNLHDQQVPDDAKILQYFPYREWADLGTKRPAGQELRGTYQFQHEMMAYDLGRLQYIPDYLLSHIIVQGRSKALTYHAIQNKVWTRIFELVFEPGNQEIMACYDAWRERASSEEVLNARSGCNTIFEPLFSIDAGAYRSYCKCGRDNPGNVMESLTGFVLWDLNDATTVWILLLMAIKCSCPELNTTLPRVIQSIEAMGRAASSAPMGSEGALRSEYSPWLKLMMRSLPMKNEDYSYTMRSTPSRLGGLVRKKSNSTKKADKQRRNKNVKLKKMKQTWITAKMGTSRSLYVGNLALGQANQANIRTFFNNALSALPEYQQKYAALLPTGAVREVRMSAEGMSAFVEFASEEIAVTCLELDKAEFLGRPIEISRPAGLVLPGPAPPPMDVSVLRNQGFLPIKAMPTKPSQNRKQRELYVGNLAIGVVTPQVLHELFEPACKVLPDYDPALGPPVLQAEIRGDGRFAFVEFQNDRLATAALSIFNGMEVLGRRLIVSRPQGFVEGGSPAGFPAPTGQQQQWNAMPQQAIGGWGMTPTGQGWGGAQQMQQHQSWGPEGYSDNANTMLQQAIGGWGTTTTGQGWGGAQQMQQHQSWGREGYSDNANTMPQQAIGGWGVTTTGQGWGGAQQMQQHQSWGPGGYPDNANIMPLQFPRNLGGQSDGQGAAGSPSWGGGGSGGLGRW